MAREYPSQPLVGVGTIVWRDHSVLLVKRGRPPRAGQWSIPGGGLELGERVEEAAAREIMEECGVSIGAPEVLTVVDLIDRDDDDNVRYHYVLIDLLAPWVSGEARPGDDAAEVRWVSREQLADLEIWDETRRVLEQAFDRLAGRPGGAVAEGG